MTSDNVSKDLPVLRDVALDLPVLLADSRPRSEPTKALSYPDWSNYSSQRHMRGLVRSSLTGDLWLATSGGVLRWHADLKTYTRYSSEHGLVGNNTRAITVDTNGRIWVAHEEGGISYFDGTLWQPYTPLATAHIHCLTPSSIGGIWLATDDMIYGIPAPDHSPAVQFPFPATPVHMLAVNDDKLWACNARGIYHYQNGAWALVFSQIGILNLACCGQQLWLGTLTGLFVLDTTTYTASRHKTWPHKEITTIAPSEDGVWIACDGYVGIATENAWTPLYRDQQLHTRIIALAPVDEDEIWLGTQYGLLHGVVTGLRFHLTESPPDVIGLSSLDPQRPAKASSNMIQSLAVSAQQGETYVWIGTPNGLYHMQPASGQWKRYEYLGLRDIRAINTDGTSMRIASWHGGLYTILAKDHPMLELSADEYGPFLTLASGISSSDWAASLDGLYHYSEASCWNRVLADEALPNSSWVRAICQTTPTSVWLGTTAGLFHYHPVTQALLPSEGLLGRADIRTLLSFAYKQTVLLWVGTAHGLYYGAAESLQPAHELSNYRITCLLYDGEGLWVGTHDGLFNMTHSNEDTWALGTTWRSSNSGLATNHIMALALSEDEQGQKQLWIGTSCGLSCYSY